MKIRIVRGAKGQVVGAFKITPRDEGAVEAECDEGEKVEEMDVPDDAMEDVEALFKKCP